MRPKPRHLAVESLRLYATRRMLWWALVVVLAVLVPGAASLLMRPGRPMEALGEVPMLDTSTEGRSGMVQVGLFSLPKPGPNQKRAGDCNPKASQVAINGGCWVRTDYKPPCPEGVQWEHEGRCWLPVAPAAPVPTTGGGLPINVASEEP